MSLGSGRSFLFLCDLSSLEHAVQRQVGSLIDSLRGCRPARLRKRDTVERRLVGRYGLIGGRTRLIDSSLGDLVDGGMVLIRLVEAVLIDGSGHVRLTLLSDDVLIHVGRDD